MNCPINCSKCCGYVLISKEIYKKNKTQVKIIKEIDMGERIGLITNDLKCAYLNRSTNRCSIYEKRPQICRDFFCEIK